MSENVKWRRLDMEKEVLDSGTKSLKKHVLKKSSDIFQVAESEQSK